MARKTAFLLATLLYLFCCFCCFDSSTADCQELSYDVHLLLADMADLMEKPTGEGEGSGKHDVIRSQTFVQRHGQVEHWEKMFAEATVGTCHFLVIRDEYLTKFGEKMQKFLHQQFGREKNVEEKICSKSALDAEHVTLIKLFMFSTKFLRLIEAEQNESVGKGAAVKQLLTLPEGENVELHPDYWLLKKSFEQHLTVLKSKIRSIICRVTECLLWELDLLHKMYMDLERNVRMSIANLMQKAHDNVQLFLGKEENKLQQLDDNHHSLSWSTFSAIFERTYSNLAQVRERFIQFEKTKVAIMKHNMQQGLSTFKMGLNKFSDWTTKEMKKMAGYVKANYKKLKDKKNKVKKIFAVAFKQKFRKKDGLTLAAKVDWREKGIVTPVKDQGDECGSCFAFAAVAAIESQFALKTKQKIILSEQQCLDCSLEYVFGAHPGGCKGGDPEMCFNYYSGHQPYQEYSTAKRKDRKKPGLMAAADYAYQGKDDSTCHYQSDKAVVKIQDWDIITNEYTDPPKDEEAMKQAVALIGPMSACFDTFESFRSYKSGVYYEPNCGAWGSEAYLGGHCILIVGYGTDEETKQDYWLAKNSWADDWGEEGYVRMARNRGNNCNIAREVIYPIVEGENEVEEKMNEKKTFFSCFTTKVNKEV